MLKKGNLKLELMKNLENITKTFIARVKFKNKVILQNKVVRKTEINSQWITIH
jgi:hypothetical protein